MNEHARRIGFALGEIAAHQQGIRRLQLDIGSRKQAIAHWRQAIVQHEAFEVAAVEQARETLRADIARRQAAVSPTTEDGSNGN